MLAKLKPLDAETQAEAEAAAEADAGKKHGTGPGNGTAAKQLRDALVIARLNCACAALSVASTTLSYILQAVNVAIYWPSALVFEGTALSALGAALDSAMNDGAARRAVRVATFVQLSLLPIRGRPWWW